MEIGYIREFNLNYVYEQCCECKYDTYGIRCPALNLIYCGDMKKLSKFRCEQCKFMYLEQHRLEMKEHDE